MNNPSTQPQQLPFALPDPAVARHPNVMLALREVRLWLDELPLGNPPRSAQQTLQHLRLLVRDPEPGPRLKALLDCYLPILERLQQIVETRVPAYADSALPLDQLEIPVLELLNELAFGYLRVCNDQLVLGKAPPLAILYRAATLLDDAATLASLHYYRPPLPQWQLLLHIYRLGEQLQINDQPADPKRPAVDGSDTLRGRFFAALLTACCDPHHQHPGRVRAWHDWILRHTEGLSLVVLPQGNAAIPVDISGQLAPLAAARFAKPGAETRYVTADPLMAALQADDTAPEDLLDALTDLIRARRAPEQRRAPRQPRNHPYQLLFGLHNIAHRLLSLNGDDDGPPPTIAKGRQIDQSKTGAAFALTGPLHAPLTVGEPLLAEAETTGEHGAPIGFLARIRRLAMPPGQEIEIGVEKLPGRVMPVDVTGSAAERTRGDTSALLIQTRDPQGFMLIAPRRIFREGDLVAVEGPDVRHSLRMLGHAGGSQRLVYIDVEVVEA